MKKPKLYLIAGPNGSGKTTESVPEKAHRALKHAVRDLIKERSAKNDKIIIWKNGHVGRISAKKA